MTPRSANLVAILLAMFFALTGSFATTGASALPAFARQTSLPCSACHVGSFGPQLTQTGRTFKLFGYTMGQTKHLWDNYAGMVLGGLEHTNKSQAEAPTAHAKTNDNVTVDQVSLFYGGRVAPDTGLFMQVTYSPNDRTLAWDNTELRYANATTLAGKGLVYGVTANNNPTLQDLWQTTPAWVFPYATSELAPSPGADAYLAGLGGQVIGVGAYAMWNDLLYVEYSQYSALSDKLQTRLGEGDVSANDHLKGSASYWRTALQRTYGSSYLEVGAYGFDADRYPGNLHEFGADHIVDTAIDGTYQFSSQDGKHIVSAYLSTLHEHQELMATFAAGASLNPADSLDVTRFNLSYNYDSTYGVTLGRFISKGSEDATLYGNPSGKPDSSATITQFDVTPFGKDGSPGSPYLNIRLFVQYTAYDKFDGAAKNYDGLGRNASDNNTLFIGTWFAY